MAEFSETPEVNEAEAQFESAVNDLEQAEQAEQELEGKEGEAEGTQVVLENTSSCSDCSGSCWLTCSGSDKWAYRT